MSKLWNWLGDGPHLVLLLLLPLLWVCPGSTAAEPPISESFCVQFYNSIYPEFPSYDIFNQTLATNCLPYLYKLKPELHGLSISTTGAYLQNWVHYSLDLGSLKIGQPDMGLKLESVVGVILQAETDESGVGAGFGRFVSCTMDNCPSYKPTEAQIVPCKAYPSVEPFPPTTFVYGNKHSTNLTKQQPKLEVLWTFSHTFCNHPNAVSFRGVILLEFTHRKKDNTQPEKKTVKAFLIPWVKIKLGKKLKYLAPSLWPVGKVNFNEALNQANYPWFQGFERQDEKDAKRPRKGNFNGFECGTKPAPDNGYNCADAPNGKKGGLPRCRGNDPDPESNHKKHPEFREYVEERLEFYCHCPRPSHPKGLEGEPHLRTIYGPRPILLLPPRITTTPPPPPKTLLEQLDPNTGLNATTFPGTDVYDFRIVHGVASVFGGMFFTPLSIFMARHYKETFMDTKILFNKPWFIMHLLTLLVNLVLTVCSGLGALLGRQIFGTSKLREGKIHRTLGFGVFGLFFLLFLTGGLRPMMCRRVGMTTHWVLGVGYYLLQLQVIWSSCNVRGSPSALPEYTFESNPHGFKHLIQIFVVTWACFDLAAHITMDVLRVGYDKLLGINRKWSLVPVPVLNEYNGTDLPGSFTRKVLLLVYMLVGVLMAGVVAVLVVSPISSSSGVGFGPMQCTHAANGKYDLSFNMSPPCRLKFLLDPSYVAKITKKNPFFGRFPIKKT